MPELPEVQTVIDGLNPKIINQTINKIKILRNRITNGSFLPMIGKKFLKLERRGKYIIFHLSSGQVMIGHLKMTGKFIVTSKYVKYHKHDRIIFFLENQSKLIFNDVRCFGRLELINSTALCEKFKNMGPEPRDKKYNAQYLKKKLDNRKISIKTLLLDQKLVAGIGNIYASEILFDAGIHPEKPGHSLIIKELKKIVQSTRKILTQALKHNGTTISDFRRVDEKSGEFQNFLKVYGRQGIACRICGEKIDKIKQNQRSTFLCPSCQT